MLVYSHAIDDIGHKDRWRGTSNHDRYADRLRLDRCQQRSVVGHHVGHKRIRRRIGVLPRFGKHGHNRRTERNLDGCRADCDGIATFGVLPLYLDAHDDLHSGSGVHGYFGVSDNCRRVSMDRFKQCLVDLDRVRSKWDRQWQHDNRCRRQQRSGAFRHADNCGPDSQCESGGGAMFLFRDSDHPVRWRRRRGNRSGNGDRDCRVHMDGNEQRVVVIDHRRRERNRQWRRLDQCGGEYRCGAYRHVDRGKPDRHRQSGCHGVLLFRDADKRFHRSSRRYGDADLRLGQCRLHLGRDDQCGMDHYPHGRDRDGQRQRHLFRAGQYRICSNGYADGCRTGRHHFAECSVYLQHFTDEHLD